MRNQQYADMNSRVTFKLDKDTQEIMFKHFIKAERYHLFQVFPLAWKIARKKIIKPGLSKKVTCLLDGSVRIF